MRSSGAAVAVLPAPEALGPLGVAAPPEQAARIWDELATGRWQILDATDHAGNRHLVLELDRTATPPDWSRLGTRERRVVALASRGLSQKVIALELRLSPSTVSQALRAVRDRLGFRCFAQLARAYRANEERASPDAPAAGVTRDVSALLRAPNDDCHPRSAGQALADP